MSKQKRRRRQKHGRGLGVHEIIRAQYRTDKDFVEALQRAYGMDPSRYPARYRGFVNHYLHQQQEAKLARIRAKILGKNKKTQTETLKDWWDTLRKEMPSLFYGQSNLDNIILKSHIFQADTVKFPVQYRNINNLKQAKDAYHVSIDDPLAKFGETGPETLTPRTRVTPTFNLRTPIQTKKDTPDEDQ